MTSYCIDVNVWLALSDPAHSHHTDAWAWLRLLPEGGGLIFSRFTQLALLRLLTNRTVMGDRTRTVREAWEMYARWLNDPRVEFHAEPQSMDEAFRIATATFDAEAASKWIGDCYLLAFAHGSSATLVTFDKGLASLAKKQGCRSVVP